MPACLPVSAVRATAQNVHSMYVRLTHFSLLGKSANRQIQLCASERTSGYAGANSRRNERRKNVNNINCRILRNSSPLYCRQRSFKGRFSPHCFKGPRQSASACLVYVHPHWATVPRDNIILLKPPTDRRRTDTKENTPLVYIRCALDLHVYRV